MTTKTLFQTYSTQAEADIAVRTFNLYVPSQGRTMESVRVGPGVYQVYIVSCPTWAEHFFTHHAVAA